MPILRISNIHETVAVVTGDVPLVAGLRQVEVGDRVVEVGVLRGPVQVLGAPALCNTDRQSPVVQTIPSSQSRSGPENLK